MGKDILRYIEDNFNLACGLRNVDHLMAKLNLSWITSRSKHPNQSEEAQETYKKFPVQYDHQNTSAYRLSSVDVWFQDEARFGLQNTTTRLWADQER